MEFMQTHTGADLWATFKGPNLGNKAGRQIFRFPKSLGEALVMVLVGMLCRPALLPKLVMQGSSWLHVGDLGADLARSNITPSETNYHDFA